MKSPATAPISSMASRRAFTIIELMVVIGIMVVLLGLLFVGGRAVIASGKIKSTRVDIENLKSLVAEMELTGTLEKQMLSVFPAVYPAGSTVPPGTPMQFSDRQVVLVLSNESMGTFGVGERFKQLPQVIEQLPDPKNGRQGQAVVDTMRVLRRLQVIPKNKTTIQTLPADKRWRLKTPDPTLVNVAPTLTLADQELFVTLDAWGNPIIFVPPGGLYGVQVNGENDPAKAVVVTSAGNYSVVGTTYPPAGRHAFFVSAGPDGDLRTGDDNVYSFEN